MKKFIFPSIAAALLSACAANGLDTQSPSASFAPAAGPEKAPAPSLQFANAQPRISDGSYTLSADEKALDCKKLTGKVQIRILELRTYSTANNTTLLSRTLQTAGKTVFGGTSAGIDPHGEHARDLAMTEAYNRELASRDCRSFDLAKEISSGEGTPEPAVPPPSKAAAQTAPATQAAPAAQSAGWSPTKKP